MPRYSYPPQGFECLYRHNCPYLGGLSTTWVYDEYQRADPVYQEHLRIIDAFHADLKDSEARIRALERENAELKAKLLVIHQNQFKANKKKEAEKSGNSENRGITDACISSSEDGKKKRGAPVGHPGWYRPIPTKIDRVVQVSAPVICPHCGSDDLSTVEGIHEHVQEDIVIRPRTVATKYLHRQAFCPRCNRDVVQAGKDEILNAPIGPVAKSAAVYLRYRIGIPYRKTGEILSDLFGLSCVPASLLGFDQKAAGQGEAIYEDLREKIRASDVVHADETSWRNDGVGHYVWYAGNKHIAFFHIDRHRSAKVAKTIFGHEYNGVLVRDRYAAYNGIGREWQSCLAHIIRRAKEINQEHALLPDAEKDSGVKAFCNAVAKLLSNACEMGNQLQKGLLSWNSAAQIETQLIKDLNKICKQRQSFKPAETLRSRLAGDDQKSLFTFLRNPGVPPTNNHAEQSIRSMVIFRKVCFGTRSEKGLKTHSILPSLVQTARRQGVHPRDFLQTLLTEDTDKAQAALYLNSS